MYTHCVVPLSGIRMSPASAVVLLSGVSVHPKFQKLPLTVCPCVGAS
jgi:hypothetical protein